MKKAGGKIYFYYGILELLKRRNDSLLELVIEARKILSKECASLLNGKVNTPLSNVPHNVISIDPKRKRVSFLWYHEFWTSSKPELLYAIVVDLEKQEYNIVTPPRSSSWPWNYLHRKEAFIEGLEELVLDPYGNGMTLSWNATERRDEWKPLPWVYVKSVTKVSPDGKVVIDVGKEHVGKTVIAILKILR